jgi:hypothetical protein
MLNKLKAWVTKFETAQKQYEGFGATDTEPDSIFQFLLYQTWEGIDTVAPSSADEWCLFCRMKGVKRAANRLSTVATHAINCIKLASEDELKEIKTFLDDYCWRVRIYNR